MAPETIALFSQGFDLAWQLVVWWWWLPLFFVLWDLFLHFWRYWRIGSWMKKNYRPMYIEVKIPRDIVKPIKAMEAVMTAIHGVCYDSPDWWEKWIDGKVITSVYYDIVSDGGNIHFYIRFHSDFRDGVEAAVYSQFPDAEIEAVPDYTRSVPEDIPNRVWNLRGWDYKLAKKDIYPLKTYEEYEEPGAEPEERIDPIAALMEGMAKIKPGEQLWIQICAGPRSEKDAENFAKEGEAERDKLAYRKEKKKEGPLWQKLIRFIFFGVEDEKEEQQEIIPLEMKLTPGERKLIEKIENKVDKPMCSSGIRVVYLGKREVWFKPNFRLAFTYFNNFNDNDLNSLIVWGETFTRVHKSWFLPYNILIPRLEYVKQRRLIRCYRNRDAYTFPHDAHDKGRFRLNVEELASLYHFPSRQTAPGPGINRTESKETVAPGNLPM